MSNNAPESFAEEAFGLYHRVTGILALMLGLFILAVFIFISLETPKPVLSSNHQGKITRYEMHKDSKSGDDKLWFQITNDQQKELDTTIFELRFPEAFRKEAFEKAGGSLNEEITIQIPTPEIHSRFNDLSQITYKTTDYVDQEILKSEAQNNRWWMLAAGIVLTLVGIFLLIAHRWLK